jgi:dTDP-4-dehydrorhamnose 3,5-epimerase
VEVKRYHIEGLLSFVPRIFSDERGAFMETFNEKQFSEFAGKPIHFVQDNQSVSIANVVRGLHFQAPPLAQGKLVRVLKGKVIDVAVDIRKNSATYGQHIAIELTAENNISFYVPEGFAHGFSVLEKDTVFAYKCTNFYSKESEGCILWNDPTLNIDWKLDHPLLSDKDKVGELFKNFKSPF